MSRASSASGVYRVHMSHATIYSQQLGHTFRRSAAGAFGPDLAKKLSQLVKMEKNLMRSMELVSRERMESAQQLSIWGRAAMMTSRM